MISAMIRTTSLALLSAVLCAPAWGADATHALSMYGDVKYPADFKHFDYVNPNAPKGGELKLSSIGTYDNFNPFISKSVAAAGLPYLGNGFIWDTLTIQSLDEPFTEYGLLAEKIEVSKDRSTVTFTLRKEARFADGKPVTAEDVRWTFETLKEKGRPFYSYYYGSVPKAEVLDKHRIRFTLSDPNNRELPLILGQLPVLPKHYFASHDFSSALLEKPLGSGPYRVSSFSFGKRVVYERRADYWAKDLPVNLGQYNFDKISYEYFLDETVSLEAFKGGAYDFRSENSAKNWATGYQSPALTRGDFLMRDFLNHQPAGMQGFGFNLRKPLLQDKTLRRAMILALDFEWSNQNLFFGQYSRTRSYFQNSDMEARGLPEGEELKLLSRWKDKLPEEVFSQSYQPPTTAGAAGIRGNLRKAQKLLVDAGYTIRNNQLYTPNGTEVKLEMLLGSALFERVVLPYKRNLKVLGIDLAVRTVDTNQYIERLRKFNYDMIVAGFPQSSSPGNEQRDYWSSSAADNSDSRNYLGIKDPVIDELVELIISAESRDQLVTRCRALDRVLQWGYYVVPNWYTNKYRIAYSKSLAHPEIPPYGFSIDIWWSKDAD